MPRYAVDLTTPEAVARQLNTVNPKVSGIPAAMADVADGQYADFRSYVTDLCHAISAYIMQACNRSFVPYVDVRSMAYRNAVYLAGNLWLDEDLLIPSTFEIGGVTIGAGDYYLLPSNRLPYDYLNFDRSVAYGISTAYGAGYAFGGTWGYVENLSQAWSLVQVSFSCTSGNTIVSVTDASLFEMLQYIKVEAEMMQITARDADLNTLTVLRGVNGTSAATHAAVPLYKFNVVSDIAFAATKLVAYYYQVRTDAGRTIQLPDGSVVISAMPDGVKEILRAYTRPVAPRSVKPRRWGWAG